MTDSNLPPITPQSSDRPESNLPDSNLPEQNRPAGSQKLPEPPIPTPSQPLLKRIPAWRFWAPLLIQFALLAAVPFKSAVTYTTGQTVTLQTAPVDPYDLLRGYSQTLRFDISNIEDLRSLPGGSNVLSANIYSREVRPFYVTLESPTASDVATDVPQAWTPVAISAKYPENLASNQVALKGEQSYRRVIYGLETYYMPEAQRNDINQHISDVQRSEDEAFVVDIKVDEKGNSVPVSLWVSDREYRF